MKKTFHINEKRVAAGYYRRIFLLNIPSLGILLSILAIVVLFYVPEENVTIPEVIHQYVFYGTYFCVLYSFIVCLIGSEIADIFLKAHREHTYIEISDYCLVVSQHCQTLFCEGRFRSYKKLWIIDLRSVESVECVKNHITINAPARYFNEDASWLQYEKTENGVDFDNWWYNTNGGKLVHTVEITDFYTHGERIVRRIKFCSEKVIERTERRERFRREMLEIARNTRHQKGISDKYIPPKYRTFR